MKKLKPGHPGKLLLNEFIKPMNLSVYRVAKDSGIPQSTLAAIVGALSGAYLGVGRLPQRLVGLLESSPKGRVYLAELADNLVTVP